ncbi:hypothetical protein VMCG_10630 [Cytospora schulzeri]|uniref:Uncharacterized protein n=1 Tax=Cytospora schulzeri TaxID=448051 RepID=A0A423VA19_9PEZI|nr:hypothetical protein VMCG_10630 [Valsa malicola]
MEGLRIEAQRLIREGILNFARHPLPDHSDVFTVLEFLQPDHPPRQQSLTSRQLRENAYTIWNPSFEQFRPPAEPMLRLVTFEFATDFSNMGRQFIYARRGVFMDIFQCFHLDEYILYMVGHDLEGFYILDDVPGREPCFCIDTVAYKLIWTHDEAIHTTNALLLSRKTKNSLQASSEFRQTLLDHRRLVSSPYLLAFVSAARSLTFINSTLTKEGINTRNMERETGWKSWRHEDGYKPNDDADPNTLMEWSWLMHSALANLHNAALHLHRTEATFELIKKLIGSYGNGQKGRRAQASNIEILRAVKVLQTQCTFGAKRIEHLEEQCRLQVSAIASTIARNDAQAALDDSTSMKVVAIMTMAFLPATFFAALFALPSLDWSQSNVIQEKFWVYWAFVVPSTLAIFAMWLPFTPRLVKWRKRKVVPWIQQQQQRAVREEADQAAEVVSVRRRESRRRSVSVAPMSSGHKHEYV